MIYKNKIIDTLKMFVHNLKEFTSITFTSIITNFFLVHFLVQF